MKKLKILLPVIALLFSVNNLIAQSSGFSDYVPTIPADRRVDWHNVGDKEIPTSFNKVFNVLNYGAFPNDGAEDRQSIQNTIEAARAYISANPGNYAVVYFPQGTYFISGGISLVNDGVKDYSNICLKGDGLILPPKSIHKVKQLSQLILSFRLWRIFLQIPPVINILKKNEVFFYCN